MATEEMKAKRLENFLDRAFRLDKRITRPSKGEYYTLTRAEVKGNSQKELSVLKKRIEQAIDIFFKQDLSYETQENLKIILSLNAQAKSSNDIVDVIDRGLVFTQQFK
ncbi:hypothetical protein ACFSKN_04900 [Mariniflexile gromovii]|uniref:Uncharacterized protein n=1 Tax=Mariniflexile gromovii TaxID=362523 RepID=A0ABS4BNN8_9FLAO|nr:hypothetical protein [Mariniflexile gromovii]MBP0902213.1 hypothetical protein [Mariniflexile gromovii]